MIWQWRPGPRSTPPRAAAARSPHRSSVTECDRRHGTPLPAFARACPSCGRGRHRAWHCGRGVRDLLVVPSSRPVNPHGCPAAHHLKAHAPGDCTYNFVTAHAHTVRHSVTCSSRKIGLSFRRCGTRAIAECRPQRVFYVGRRPGPVHSSAVPGAHCCVSTPLELAMLPWRRGSASQAWRSALAKALNAASTMWCELTPANCRGVNRSCIE